MFQDRHACLYEKGFWSSRQPFLSEKLTLANGQQAPPTSFADSLLTLQEVRKTVLPLKSGTLPVTLTEHLESLNKLLSEVLQGDPKTPAISSET